MMPALRRWLAPFLLKGAAIAGLLFAAWLYIGHVERAAKRQQKAADQFVVDEARLRATAAALEQARQTEAMHARATREANDALFSELADARARLAVHLARLRDQGDQGGARPAGLPTTADAAGIVDRADRAAVLADDLRRCTDNTVRLINAQAWAEKELVK